MYIPLIYQNTNEEEVRDFLQANGFGILVSRGQRLTGTHIPLFLGNDGTLSGHVSKANSQWKNFSDGEEVLAIFQGPHTYVSSSWYDHENVPTWNYIAVHVYGTIKILHGDDLLESLKSLTNKYEKNSARPVTVEGFSPDFLRSHLNGLVGFSIQITEVQAAKKLSQNRDAKNHTAIISELEKRGDQDSRLVAEAMKSNKPVAK